MLLWFYRITRVAGVGFVYVTGFGRTEEGTRWSFHETLIGDVKTKE